MSQVTFTKDETSFALEVESLPATAIAYLLQYGFSQSMQDCIAGLAKAKKAELEETDDFKSGKLTPDGVADEVTLAIMAQLEKRMTAIREGTIGIRAPGVAKDPLSSLAREQVRAALAKKGVKVEKDKLAELVAAHVEKNRAKLEAELARRAEEAVEVEIDL